MLNGWPPVDRAAFPPLNPSRWNPCVISVTSISLLQLALHENNEERETNKRVSSLKLLKPLHQVGAYYSHCFLPSELFLVHWSFSEPKKSASFLFSLVFWLILKFFLTKSSVLTFAKRAVHLKPFWTKNISEHLILTCILLSERLNFGSFEAFLNQKHKRASYSHLYFAKRASKCWFIWSFFGPKTQASVLFSLVFC